jgi:DNA-binding NtrC family response regulator/tetratricopeptide (TPR) repeat protein
VRNRSIRGSFYLKKLRGSDGGRATFHAIAAGGDLAAHLALEKEDAVELLADRFAMTDTGRVIDLATGESVALTITSAGGPTDQTRWAVRCDTLHRLRHRAIAPLVDYGAIGDAQRFEAWRCGSPWTGVRAQAEQVVRRAAAFLRGCGLTPGGLSVDAVRCSPDGAVVLPDSEAGYVDEGGPSVDAASVALDTCGFVIQARRLAPALAELFDGTGGMQPRIAAVWGPPGAGTSTIVADVARVARLNGFVPVGVPLDAFSRVLRGRSLFLIADAAAAGWKSLLHASLQSPRPHVLLFAGVDEIPSVDGIALERMSAETFVSSIRPRALPRDLDRRVRQAAEQADGLPGRFVRLLWRDGDGSAYAARQVPRTSVRVAEQAAAYGVEEPSIDAAAMHPSANVAWPAPGELAALRRRMEAACQLLQSGRHEPGERALRQAIGALARRGDWAHAGTGALALASSQLKRGRPKDAQATLEEAKEYWGRGTDHPPLLETAALMGAAWIDLARLDEAESLLGAAFAARRAGGSTAAGAGLALARCLFWRGRYADADRTVASIGDSGLADQAAVRAGVLVSRVAVGRRDLARAVGGALEAVDRARRSADAGLVAEATSGAAFAHLAVGDLDAAERDVADCLAAARIVRDPLRAIRARLLLAESARRRGRRGAVTTLLQRLTTLGGARVPPIVGARCALLKDLVTGAGTDREAVQRHVAATGLNALALFAPLDGQPPREGGVVDPALDDMVEILRVCQNADEEVAVLTEVCSRLRRQLRAVAVAFIVVDGAALPTIASDGGRIESGIAERAVAAGIAIAPHRHEDRREAAAPVKYGGTPIGALVARWTLGSTHDLAGAASVLTMAAAAAAPAVSAAVTHRVRATGRDTTGLLGGSDAMAEVRRAIERAARAPFPVLIEGESGCGKELIARALHRSGVRRERSFCTLNCAALPDELIEAELFGHARGAFTGAVAERPGVFEEAHGGTLLLDEIGELSPRAQAKVLRVIQEGELRRVGENVSRRVDVRIVAATNRDLRVEAAAARFRVDLLYRLDVVRIAVPPLRDRREDIALLADHFWREATARVASRATLAAATLSALARYDWPGNVRELQNVLAALAVRSPKRGVVPPTALPASFGESRSAEPWRLDQARRTFEERFIRAALVRTGGHRARAASELGVTRQGLTKLMARLGISSE